jgi:hypothetical protein
VLSPCVLITPDVSALRECQHTVWAAIEVAGRLSQIPVAGVERSETVTGTFIEHKLGKLRHNPSLEGN